MLRFLLLPFLLVSSAVAQATIDVTRERADYIAWLTNASNSPLAALAQRAIGEGITLGPGGSDIPLDGLTLHEVRERGGAVVVESAGAERVLPRHRTVPLGRYTVYAGGPAGRTTLTVFARTAGTKRPSYYPVDRALVFTGRLHPPARPGTVRLLGADGIEVDASEAGTVIVPLNGGVARLMVRRFSIAGTEESELEIYFRDGTNGSGTYPAGRFVNLTPLKDGKYRLDFNRARNPFCAYSSVYPCPLPWRGNEVPGTVRAGERYEGGGLKVPTPSPEVR